MARILWHGISPYWNTGYGVQARLFAPLIRDLGHEVVICQMGNPHPADKHGEFNGVKIIGGQKTRGNWNYLPRPMDIRAAFDGKNPDLVLILKDPWILPPEQYRAWNAANWVNIDCDPASVLDVRFFRESGATPIAVSKFGLSAMRKAGLKDARYVPHGIDTGFWTPGDRAAARELLGLPRDAFIAGINGANLGTPPRKAFYEQFAAFASLFHGEHNSKALLLAHTDPDAHLKPDERGEPMGMPLRPLARRFGIEGAVKFGRDHFAAAAEGGRSATETEMRSWYRSLDVLMSCSYGEGFGIPVCEALSCGIPVIATDCSALTEKVPPGAGWLVGGQRFWVPAHEAEWTIPRIKELTAKLGLAKARQLVPPPEYGAQWDAQRIAREYWKPVLEELTS